MKICIIGAGAMGGLYGGRLLLSGQDVQFIEHRQQAVDALNQGDYLVDDRTKNGADRFTGEHLHFGTEKFPDWRAVTEYLCEGIGD